MKRLFVAVACCTMTVTAVAGIVVASNSPSRNPSTPLPEPTTTLSNDALDDCYFESIIDVTSGDDSVPDDPTNGPLTVLLRCTMGAYRTELRTLVLDETQIAVFLEALNISYVDAPPGEIVIQ